MVHAQWDEIVRRRFGSRHEKPCINPSVLTCAKVKCQLANRCKHDIYEEMFRERLMKSGVQS